MGTRYYGKLVAGIVLTDEQANALVGGKMWDWDVAPLSVTGDFIQSAVSSFSKPLVGVEYYDDCRYAPCEVTVETIGDLILEARMRVKEMADKYGLVLNEGDVKLYIGVDVCP